MDTRKIKGGLYLVIDPSQGIEKILSIVQEAIVGGVDVLQIWNNWGQNQNKHVAIEEICRVAHHADVPVIINDDYALLKETSLDGVHFDSLPLPVKHIRRRIGRPVLIGITCNNDMQLIENSLAEQPDYISFCSLFPSSSVTSCELVDFDTIKKTMNKSKIPVFVSGGINIENAHKAMSLGVDGLAVISVIMSADDPKIAASDLKKIIEDAKIKGE